MKTTSAVRVLGTFLLGFLVVQARAGDVTNPASVIRPVPAEESQPQARLVSGFSGFAGSEQNARSLVTGLRQGNAITLNATGTEGSGAGESVTFTPATRPMGYGNVRIALALAQEQLAQNGITQPTPDQIRAALAGGTLASGVGEPGTTTRLQGVLQMRADGMGWGRIAQSMDVKLGAVMSGRTGAQAATTPTAPSADTGSTRAASAGGAGITTAAGTASAGITHGRGNSPSAQSGPRPGAGIVTASGSPAAGISAGARAHGGGSGGSVATAAGVAARGSNGQALAKGHARN